MSKQLNLRLLDDDERSFNDAAAIIAGPAGVPYLGRMVVVRTAVKAFIAQHQAAEESSRG